MKRWQLIYLVIVFIGFILGWMITPWVGVVFIWLSIIIIELRGYFDGE